MNEQMPFKSGVEISPNSISYSDSTINWAILFRALGRFDSDTIEDDAERAYFMTWRESIKSAVIAAFAMAWMDDKLLANVLADIQEYL